MACVPAAIATFVEVAGTLSSTTILGATNLNGDVCFRADTGYNSCLKFNSDNAVGQSFCSPDGIWCFKLASFDGTTGSTTYSIQFANRESTEKSSVDVSPDCALGATLCTWEIPNQEFDM
ncbi:7404_t:CDS:1 [Funneliformis caledonium]|uniref:7404_t:CDS:1 n=1 Tax=Funneliformis caledonium TaxID=1117310 RepID=A0A9N9B0R0_9GLOM|nr:7404_t:CDS:1 [Funneliformis caledonium]